MEDELHTDRGAEASYLDQVSGEKSTQKKERKWDLVKENYSLQIKRWPASGKYILAHYNDTSVVVYQAFKPSIAEFAVKNQRFGGPHYNFERMSWVKTNFLWMMYRCGWAQKLNQESVLAVRITRAGFEDILSKAFTIVQQKAQDIQTKDIEVRLQWDPDHDPNGEKLPRRAIQLGLKGKTLLNYTSKYIVDIKDITDFVLEQYEVLKKEGPEAIVTPLERIYIPSSESTCQQIELDNPS